MNEFFEKLDPKTLAVIITSAGGVILAGFMAYANYKLSSNDIQHTNQAIRESSQEQTAAITGMREDVQNLTRSIDSQSKVLELWVRK
mgnify:CR=1 FL=1